MKKRQTKFTAFIKYVLSPEDSASDEKNRSAGYYSVENMSIPQPSQGWADIIKTTLWYFISVLIVLAVSYLK